MKQCVRCSKWFRDTGSSTCDPCWEDLGQMRLDFDDEADEYEPDIDSIFDRWAERENRLP